MAVSEFDSGPWAWMGAKISQAPLVLTPLHITRNTRSSKTLSPTSHVCLKLSLKCFELYYSKAFKDVPMYLKNFLVPCQFRLKPPKIFIISYPWVFLGVIKTGPWKLLRLQRIKRLLGDSFIFQITRGGGWGCRIHFSLTVSASHWITVGKQWSKPHLVPHARLYWFPTLAYSCIPCSKKMPPRQLCCQKCEFPLVGGQEHLHIPS